MRPILTIGHIGSAVGVAQEKAVDAFPMDAYILTFHRPGIAKIQRRHFVTTYAFTSQTGNEGSDHLYVQFLSSKDGGLPSVMLTADYEFTAVKKGNMRKLGRWAAHGDHSLD